MQVAVSSSGARIAVSAVCSNPANISQSPDTQEGSPLWRPWGCNDTTGQAFSCPVV